jgi:hypothetical protein
VTNDQAFSAWTANDDRPNRPSSTPAAAADVPTWARESVVARAQGLLGDVDATAPRRHQDFANNSTDRGVADESGSFSSVPITC